MPNLITGDCLTALAALPADSIHACITDPPYGISFLGHKWDYAIPSVAVWSAVYRTLKPGAFLLSFASTRTSHRIATAIEDAGFTIRDTIAWVYGSGFPKSQDVSKAIDKHLGATPKVVGEYDRRGLYDGHRRQSDGNTGQSQCAGRSSTAPLTEPATDQAAQWAGWGTALKPAFEPIIVARKPFTGTVAANVLEYGCGAMNLGACRVPGPERYNPPTHKGPTVAMGSFANCQGQGSVVQGRWPANFIHDGFDMPPFFYVAKPSKAERERGLEHLPAQRVTALEGGTMPDQGHRFSKTARNVHPTVKPLQLMRYLCQLVTPPNGTILDPYAGSGSTLIAAKQCGFDYVGIELSPEYCAIAQARLQAA